MIRSLICEFISNRKSLADIVFDIGGPADAFRVAETIRHKVMHWSEGRDVNTVSIGVASLTPGAGMHWALLLEAADKALYAAKASGRNQSVLASMPKLSLVA